MRRRMSAVSISRWITNGRRYPCCFNNSPRYCAWATVRGNPSNTKPCEQSGRSMRSATILSTSESGTSSPRSIIGSAFTPSGVPRATCSRSMSPVERCGTEYLAASFFACVPFPAPGGPRKITARLSSSGGRFSGTTGLVAMLLTPPAQPALSSKSFVVPHDQLCFQLLHGVHGHADDDQQRRAAEIKLHAQTFQKPHREVAIKPGTDAPSNMVKVNARDHPFRQQTNDRKINRTDERQPLQNLADMLGRVAPGPDAGNESSVLAHIVRKLRWIENNSDIKEREQQNHRDVHDGIERLTPLQAFLDGVQKRPTGAHHQSSRRRKCQQRTRENRRNHAAGIDAQWQIRRLTAHHSAANDPLRILHGNAALAAFHKHDERHNRDHQGNQENKRQPRERPPSGCSCLGDQVIDSSR